MSSKRDKREPWLDEELKNVPLPDGLLARLKQIGSGPEAQLDAALCDVVLPKGLRARLRAIAREDAFDEALRGVPVPAGLRARLHAITAYSDAEIDAQLRDVPVPRALRERLQALTRRGRILPSGGGHSPVVQWALAASLLLGVSLSYFAAMAGWMVAIYPIRSDDPALPLQRQQPMLEGSQPAPPPPTTMFVEKPRPETEPLARAALPDEAELANPAPQTPPPGALAEVQRLFASDSPKAVDTLDRPLPGDRRFAASTAVPDTLPELQVVDVPPPRGVLPPRVKQFDLLALLKDGVHPFVSPSAHPQLELSRVPLVTRTTSYQRARAAIRQGRLPDPSQVRVEEFLAAVDYDFAEPAEGMLGLRTAAGPSPFGEENTHLMQVGVQAAQAPLAARQVTHLTLAIDVSASMQRGERLDSVRRAIAELLPKMAARDELALVIFSEQAELVIRGIGRDDAARVLPALEAIDPRSSTNLGAGLQLAANVAQAAEVDPRVARRIVLLTDGLGQIPQSAVARLEGLVADTVAQGVAVEIVDVGPEPALDEQLTRLATAAGSHVRYAEGAEAIRYVLQEILTAQSQVLARQTRLTVKFNPKSVAAYRLLGHEADSLGGLQGGPLELDLRSGEAATALYEIKLKPSGGNDVALVLLSWRDPQSGVENRITQRISRLQFATALRASPVSLQRAAIVAETAEILRGSAFAPSPTVGLRQVVERVGELATPALEDPSFRQFLQMLKAAQHQRGGRSAGGSGLPWWRTATR